MHLEPSTYSLNCNATPSQIVTLLQNVPAWPGFKHEGSKEDFWHWRYNNSLKQGLISTVYYEGKPVSHAAALPIEIFLDGKVLRGAQWSDFCTAPDFRNQGLIEKAVKKLTAAEIAAGIETDFSFPSFAGYSIAVNAGMVEIPCRFKQYEYILDPDSFFGSSKTGKVKKVAYETTQSLRPKDLPDSSKINVEKVQKFPEDLNEVTADFEADYDISLRHNTSYLNHRYAHSYSGEFHTAVAEKSGRSCGYLVLRPYIVDNNRYMDIVDLCADSHMTARALLKYAKEACSRYGSNTLHIWLSGTDWLSYDVMRCGFKAIKPIEGERIMRFLMRRFDDEKIPKNPICHLTLGDTDWV